MNIVGTVKVAEPLNGNLATEQGLTGSVDTESGVSGSVTAKAQLVGGVSGEAHLSGDVSPAGVLQGIVALAKTIGVSPEVITKAIADYFEKNPVTVVTKYPDLEQKPKINGVELDGDKSASDLQLQPAGKYLTEIPSEYVTEDELSAKGYAVKTDIPSVPRWAMQEAKPAYTAAEVGADQSGTADGKVSEHNVNTAAHNDIRVLLSELTNRLNALADSDDTTLDQMSEIVAYIKSNKSLIESVTTEKVSYTDIIDNLVTNLHGKPLSAAQGVALKALIDAIKVPTKVSELYNDEGYLKEHQSLAAYALKTEIPTVPKNVSAFSNDAGYLTQHQDISGKLDADKLPQAIDSALAQAKESGEFKGEPGYTPQRGKDYWTDDDKAEMTTELSGKYLPLKGGSVSGTIKPNGNQNLGAVDSPWRTIYGKSYYMANASTVESDYSFGMYQWKDNMTFNRRNAADNAWVADCWSIDGATGITDFKVRPTIKGTDILELVYPVGAIYLSAVSTSPATLFGFGTWERIQNRFLLAAGSAYAAGSTGGAATHALSVDELPSHSHGFVNEFTNRAIPSSQSGSFNIPITKGSAATSSVSATNNEGGGKAHNNMPPYLAVYVWKRTA